MISKRLGIGLSMLCAMAVGMVGAGCKKTAPSPAASATRTRSFTLGFSAIPNEAENVKGTIVTPSEWQESTSNGLELQVKGDVIPSMMVVMIPCGDRSADECMTHSIELQFGKDPASYKRENLADGRVRVREDSAGRTHARLFVPAPKVKGMVMCIALLLDEKQSRVDEYMKACDTLKLETGATN